MLDRLDLAGFWILSCMTPSVGSNVTVIVLLHFLKLHLALIIRWDLICNSCWIFLLEQILLCVCELTGLRTCIPLDFCTFKSMPIC